MTPPPLSLGSQGAIVWDAQWKTQALPRSDDGSSGPVPLGFPVTFFGKTYTHIYVNTNGNVTFGEPFYTYTPFRLTARMPPIIAPFLADVDTRHEGSGRVVYSQGTVSFEGRPAFFVNWMDVGYHPKRSDKLNSFQLLLVDRNDTGTGNFDIVMNYGQLTWEAGETSGGSNGLGGTTAGVGFSAGTGDAASFFELPGSLVSGALLDTNTVTGLVWTKRGSSQPGRHVFEVRNGVPERDPTWNYTQRLAELRTKASPRAVLLANGRVLVMGGYNTATDVYDPATGTWTPVGDATTTRREHTATLLKDGRVLVVGGASGRHATSTELHDPATSSWSPAAPMNVARIQHTATLLEDGRVLVAGGGSTGQEDSAEVYDPVSNTWTLTGRMTSSRALHTATLLANGQVLVAGGQRGSTALASAEVYEPGTGAWSPVGNMGVVRRHHTATRLADARVLVAGGGSDGKEASAEVYDPASRTWSPTGNMQKPRRYHTATLLKTGHVLVAGGFDESTGSLTAAELYVPTTGTWRGTAAMLADHYHHSATLLNSGQVLVVGGVSNTDQRSAEIFTR